MTASTGSAPAVPPVTTALRAQAARQRTTRLLHLSGHHLEAGNPAPALDALGTGLTNAPADERLWNELLRATHATGDTARLESAAAALVARRHELSGGARGLPPRTEALLDKLLPAWREAPGIAD
ncbi:putative Zn-dependent protease [Streptomyces sp. SAI-135]|nr:putative Zn-dependent protease [Streptomyces sp. SAI-090]MDH6617794.1 putative Zn-dependent protease [Streptomyces sp. SAI-135]